MISAVNYYSSNVSNQKKKGENFTIMIITWSSREVAFLLGRRKLWGRDVPVCVEGSRRIIKEMALLVCLIFDCVCTRREASTVACCYVWHGFAWLRTKSTPFSLSFFLSFSLLLLALVLKLSGRKGEGRRPFAGLLLCRLAREERVWMTFKNALVVP